MWKTSRILVLATLALAYACGESRNESGESDGIAEVRQALAEVGTLRRPCADGRYTFEGTAAQLLSADAMAVCQLWVGDRALAAVGLHAKAAFGDWPGNVPADQQWRAFRADEDKNCDPDNIDLTGAVFLPEYEEEQKLFADAPGDVQWAVRNLCIANFMRNASSGAGLLLSDADAREVLTFTSYDPDAFTFADADQHDGPGVSSAV